MENKELRVEFSRQDLRRLIIPLVVEQLLAITVGLFDSVMVSHVGEAAISAVSLVDTVNVLLVNAFSALATGGAVIAGQYLGRREAGMAGHAGCNIQSIEIDHINESNAVLELILTDEGDMGRLGAELINGGFDFSFRNIGMGGR